MRRKATPQHTFGETKSYMVQRLLQATNGRLLVNNINALPEEDIFTNIDQF